MKFIKKSFIYIFIILLLISIYKDLVIGSLDLKQLDDVKSEKITNHKTNVVKVKVQQGENVLYIVEKINDINFNKLNIEQILNDFQKANPHVDPYHLQSGNFYYFPLYQ